MLSNLIAMASPRYAMAEETHSLPALAVLGNHAMELLESSADTGGSPRSVE